MQMSIVSSRVSSVSSILKGSGVRTSLLNQKKKICFKLPSDLKSTLLKYENKKDCPTYLDLICILRDSTVKDDDLLKFINDVRENILLLRSCHKLLIEALFNLKWTNRSESIVNAFKKFVEELTCAHPNYSQFVINTLVKQFKISEEGAPDWENGKCPDADLAKFNHIHDILKIITIVPLNRNLLMESLGSSFPHSTEGCRVIERYVFALLQVTKYSPYLQTDILSLIIHRLIMLDVSSQLSDSVDALDLCMEQMFAYVYDCCYVNKTLHKESLKIIYNDLLSAFERQILRTSNCRHVQFIMFYLCSFHEEVLRAFVFWLWQKASNPKEDQIFRQNAIYYISSLLARAPFATLRIIHKVMSDMATWIHEYINLKDGLEYKNNSIEVHLVFYSVCQALFYLLAFRHKDIADDTRNLMFLQGLHLTKIVTCKLNPLKVCQPVIIQNFANVTRKYQLAYCQTVIECNSRNTLPIIDKNQWLTRLINIFFPFDPYVLNVSGHRINSMYNICQILSVDSEQSPVKEDKNEMEWDDDDFMDDSFLESYNHPSKCSYSTSPGVLQT